MKKIIFTLPLLTITAASNAMNHGLYISPAVGLQNLLPKINIVDVDGEDLSTSSIEQGNSAVFGSLALGYNHRLNNRFAIGIQADGRFTNTKANIKATNLDMEENEFSSMSIATKFKHSFGINLRPAVLLNENASAFILAGYRHTTLNYAFHNSDNDIANLSKNLNHHGFEYGLGAEISLNDQISMRIEASQTRYKSKNIWNTAEGTFSAKTTINQGTLGLLWYPQWI